MRISDWSSDVCSSDLNRYLICLLINSVYERRLQEAARDCLVDQQVEDRKKRYEVAAKAIFILRLWHCRETRSFESEGSGDGAGGMVGGVARRKWPPCGGARRSCL